MTSEIGPAAEHRGQSTFSAWLQELARFPDRPTADDPVFSLGEVVLDRYELRSQLGRGGMGIVYEAFDRATSSSCALKTLRRCAPERITMLKNEFRAVAKVRHPNLVRPGELLEDRGRWFYTMELIRGPDPTEWAARDTDRIRTVALGLASALSCIHAHGLVHRDVKPANVIVTERGAVLVDLGLARDAERPLWFDRPDVGTTLYMAPELSTGVAVGTASDMYSLGVLLYELASGRAPFEEVGPALVARKRSNSISPIVVAPELDAIIRGLLVADPARRFTAAHVIERLGGRPRYALRSSASVFVGREPELERLRSSFAVVEAGNHAAVFVHGPSGIGKTAMVDRFLSEVEPNTLVLAGRCYERETVSFKAIDGVIDALASHLALQANPGAVLEKTRRLRRVFPALAAAIPDDTTDSQWERDAATDGADELAAELRGVIDLLARTARVIIFIDDLQWADSDGLRVLARLLTTEPPCLLIATSRSRERSEKLADLRHAASIHLEPLSAVDAARLAGELAGTSGNASTVVADACGDPYLIHELSRTAPPRDLDEHARDLLALIVAAGSPIELAVLAKASDMQWERVDQHVQKLVDERRVRRIGGIGPRLTVDTFHGRLREHAYAALGETVHKKLHARLARAYEQVTPDEHARIAVHLAGAGETAGAGNHALRAAELATRRAAFAHAAEMLGLALRVHAGERQVLLERLAEAFELAWQPLSAATAYIDASASASPARARELRMRAIDQWLIGGDLRRGLRELAELLRERGVRTPVHGWSVIATMILRRMQLRGRTVWKRRAKLTPADIDLLWSASSALSMIDAPLALGYHTLALLALWDVDDPRRLSRSLSIESCVQAGSGNFVKAEHLIARTADLVREHGLDNTYVRPGQIVLAVQHGEWKTALRLARDAEGRQLTAWHKASRDLYQAHCEWNLGRFAELDLRCDRSLREARDRGDRFLELATSVSFAPLVALVRDDIKGARSILERGASLLWRGGQGGYFHALAACAARFIHLYEGGSSSPDPLGERLARRSHYGRVYLEFLGATEALARHRAHPERQLRARIERTIRRLTKDVVPWAAPFGSLLAVQLRGGDGDAKAARVGFARFEMGHMLDILDFAPDRLRARGVVRPDRFTRMLAPVL